MTPERYQVVKKLFIEAQDLATAKREALLAKSCADDVELRAAVEEMLLAHDEAGGFLRPISVQGDVDDQAGALSALPLESASGAALLLKIGRYHIKSAIASGGMGTVYLAVQENPRRKVALKVMKAGIASPSALRRFEFEAQILARLRHPNIAQIYEAGAHRDPSADRTAPGMPYFAMEYVPGAKSITEFATTKSLSLHERLQLFAKVCDAVYHGHQRGIIHRDLKPGNILVTSSGEPKIIDFGVARATDSDMAITLHQTDVGQLVGTLQYMSPEQCEADPEDLDTRSDVYALGVVLYELLTHRHPYEMNHVTVLEAARLVREAVPPSPGSIDRDLRGDLETISLKALEKDRGQRYQSASDMAQDIRRYLCHEPITAQPPSTLYRIRKFTRRHRTACGAATLVAVCLVIATVVSIRYAVEAEFQLTQRISADERASEQRTAALLVAAEAALADGDVAAARRRLEIVPEPHRTWEWAYLSSRTDRSLRTIAELERPSPFAISPDGASFAIGGVPGEATVLDLRTGQPRRFLRFALEDDPRRGRLVGTFTDLGFDPSGEHLAATVRIGHDRTRRGGLLALWDSGTSELLRIVDQPLAWKAPMPLAWSSDGAWIAIGEPDGWVRIVALGDHVDRDAPKDFLAHAGEITALAINPRGSRLASASQDGSVRIWDMSSPHEAVEVVAPGGASITSITSAASDALDEDIFAWCQGLDIVLWDSSSGSSHVLRGHKARVNGIAFAPDAKTLVSGGEDRTVRIWDAKTRDQVALLLGHVRGVRRVRFHPSGDRVISADAATIKEWDADAPLDALAIFHGLMPVSSVSLGGSTSDARSSNLLVSGARDGSIGVWDAVTGNLLTMIRGHRGPRATVARLDPTGRRLVSGGSRGVVKLWQVPEGRPLETLGQHDHPIQDIRFSPDGSTIATLDRSGTVKMWASASREAIREFTVGLGDESSLYTAHAMSFSPDGALLAISPGHRCAHPVVVLDATSGRRVWEVDSEGHTGVRPVFADGAEALILGGSQFEKAITLAGEQVWQTDLLTGTSLALGASPDGRRVAAWMTDGSLLLLNSDNGLEMLRIPLGLGVAEDLAFSSNGERIAVACFDGTVYVVSREWGGALTDGQRRERKLRARVHALLRRLYQEQEIGEAVIEALQAEPGLGEDVRQAAMDEVRLRGDDPVALNAFAWRIVKRPGHSQAEYGRALRIATTASRMNPESIGFHGTLGIAQYRVGRFKDAVGTLSTNGNPQGDEAARLAVLAMALHRLGEERQASDHLDRLREMIVQTDDRDEAEAQARTFLAESEEVLQGQSGDAAPNGPE